MPDDLNMKISETYATIFKNMTLEEYDKYVKDFVDKPADGYDNLRRGDAFYRPMLEIIEYLQQNDFNIFITSATDRYQVRSLIEGHINIPNNNIIGSDYLLKASNQGSEKGYNYDYSKNDVIKIEGDMIHINIKANKALGIIREIGKQPILSFWNCTSIYSKVIS